MTGWENRRGGRREASRPASRDAFVVGTSLVFEVVGGLGRSARIRRHGGSLSVISQSFSLKDHYVNGLGWDTLTFGKSFSESSAVNPDLSLFPNRSALAPAVWQERSLSTAYRLLTGLGTSVLVAYREVPLRSFSAVVHGVTRSGDVVVAISAHDPLAHKLDSSDPVSIRLSIDKAAPNVVLNVVAASLHLLGQAQWLDPEEQHELLASGELSERVAEVARAGYLARISFDRVLLHDACGVTPIDAAELLAEHERCLRHQEEAFFCSLERDLFSNPELELTAVDVVDDSSLMDAAALFDGLMLGALEGAFIARQDVVNVCAHSLGVICLDVDRTGMTLMCVDHVEAVTAFIPFAKRVSTRSELVSEIADLRLRS